MLIKPFVWCHSRNCRRRGLLKLPTINIQQEGKWSLQVGKTSKTEPLYKKKRSSRWSNQVSKIILTANQFALNETPGHTAYMYCHIPVVKGMEKNSAIEGREQEVHVHVKTAIIC